MNKQKVNFTLYLKNAFASLYINDDSDYINQNQAGWSSSILNGSTRI